MPEMFAGDWDLRYTDVDPLSSNRVVIYGSDQADGTYTPRFGGDEVTVSITGGMWSADMQTLNSDTGEWESRPARRTMRFDRKNGTTVRLDTAPQPIDGKPQIYGNAVELVYRDPDLNPPPVEDAFDFTYGRHD